MPLAEQRDSASPVPSRPPSGPGGQPRSPSALNLPNIITLSRLVLAVFLFWLIDTGGHWLAACVLFLIAAATDAIDGYIARRYGLVTKIGRIFDPFVDKVIIGGAFMFLAVQPDSGVNAWMVMAVIGREMFVTSLRSVLESEGKDFSATMSGKLKMVVQCAAVAGSLLFLEFLQHNPGRDLVNTLATVRDVILWGAVAITLYSGYDYIVRAVKLFRQG
ncbi:MAG: CDP-diacylglycerol--glycerol-3-phosphate 3-phosphatidyltransferase [Deltaproteobacteria bacterium]